MKKNILLFYQPIADLVIEFLGYKSIYLLQKKGVYNSDYYKEIIYRTGFEEFAKLVQYKRFTGYIVDISTCHFKKIPPSIGVFTNLKYLHLSYNKLKFLPENIVNLINLEKLLLRNNKLKRLLKHFGKLSKLEYLDLSFNCELKRLPDSIVNLTNLKHLFINGTVIFPIPVSPNFKPKIKY